MKTVNAGPGDPCTWGIVLDAADPRYVGISGPVSIEMTIGEGDADVIVTRFYDNDDYDDFGPHPTIVMYQGVDIFDALHESQWVAIRNALDSTIAKRQRAALRWAEELA